MNETIVTPIVHTQDSSYKRLMLTHFCRTFLGTYVDLESLYKCRLLFAIEVGWPSTSRSVVERLTARNGLFGERKLGRG